jgi:hypothetical protein
MMSGPLLGVSAPIRMATEIQTALIASPSCHEGVSHSQSSTRMSMARRCRSLLHPPDTNKNIKQRVP